MLIRCMRCKQATQNTDPRIKRSQRGRKYLSAKCAVCGAGKSKFISESEATTLSGQGVVSDFLKEIGETVKRWVNGSKAPTSRAPAGQTPNDAATRIKRQQKEFRADFDRDMKGANEAFDRERARRAARR